MVSITSIILLAAGLVSAAPRKSSATSPTISPLQDSLPTATDTGSPEPCAIVSRSLASQASCKLSDCDNYSLDLEHAQACLRSVPVDHKGGIAQLDGLKELLEFQSNLGYLKDPPLRALYDGVDLITGIEKLSEALSLGEYDNEYDFQNAVYLLFVSAHDGHLSYAADIRNVFIFSQGYELISLSLDGQTLPQVYAYSDFQAILDTANDDISEYTPSPITSIQGQPVDIYLGEQASRYGSSQDPDANYNSFFINAPPLAEGANFNIPIFDNKSTHFGFANGTEIAIIHGVTVWEDVDFDGVVDGETFYEKFCTSNLTKSMAFQFSKGMQRNLMAPISDLNSSVIEDTIKDVSHENENFAVLSVKHFGSDLDLDSEDTLQFVKDFGNVARNFTTAARSAGKSKLIIDLRGNSGGLMITNYALFKILCPSLAVYAGFNLRAFPLANHMGQSISGSDDSRRANWHSAYNYQYHMNTSLGHFMSWKEFYGPHESHNDSFMSVARENLHDTAGAGELPGGGYNSSDDDLTSPKYAPEDIILLLDGQCASACSIFVETMKTEAGVRQIVIGGRPQYGPMQGVGGTKGSEILGFPQLVEFVMTAKSESSKDAIKDFWNTDEAPNLDNMDRAIARGHGFVNFKNSIRRGDDLNTPLHFIYEAADCRLFYTPDMYKDAKNIYTAVYDAIWGHGKCVSGSTGHPSSISGLTGSDALIPPPPGARPASL